jgi:hypothetical protein
MRVAKSTIIYEKVVDGCKYLCEYLDMADKPSSISLTAADLKIVAGLRRAMLKDHGAVSLTFIVRKALRALQQAQAAQHTPGHQ